MASGRNAGRGVRVIKQYKILAEFDGGDGRHYIPGEVVSLEKWRPEHIQDLFTRRFAVELDQPPEAPSSEGEEVEKWQELQPEM